MLIGYARISSDKQSIDEQRALLIKYGVDPLSIYIEEGEKMNKERLILKNVLSELKAGDIIVVADITCISIGTRDLISIFRKIEKSGAYIKSIKNEWFDSTPANRNNILLRSVMQGISEFEKQLASQRIKVARGRNGGRPTKISKKVELVASLMQKQVPVAEIIEIAQLSRSSVYRIIRDISNSNNT
jgi:DNA invertase Pin-like site-specific DNA recombinase